MYHRFWHKIKAFTAMHKQTEKYQQMHESHLTAPFVYFKTQIACDVVEAEILELKNFQKYCWCLNNLFYVIAMILINTKTTKNVDVFEYMTAQVFKICYLPSYLPIWQSFMLCTLYSVGFIIIMNKKNNWLDSLDKYCITRKQSKNQLDLS